MINPISSPRFGAMTSNPFTSVGGSNIGKTNAVFAPSSGFGNDLNAVPTRLFHRDAASGTGVWTDTRSPNIQTNAATGGRFGSFTGNGPNGGFYHKGVYGANQDDAVRRWQKAQEDFAANPVEATQFGEKPKTAIEGDWQKGIDTNIGNTLKAMREAFAGSQASRGERAEQIGGMVRSGIEQIDPRYTVDYMRGNQDDLVRDWETMSDAEKARYAEHIRTQRTHADNRFKNINDEAAWYQDYASRFMFPQAANTVNRYSLVPSGGRASSSWERQMADAGARVADDVTQRRFANLSRFYEDMPAFEQGLYREGSELNRNFLTEGDRYMSNRGLDIEKTIYDLQSKAPQLAINLQTAYEKYLQNPSEEGYQEMLREMALVEGASKLKDTTHLRAGFVPHLGLQPMQTRYPESTYPIQRYPNQQRDDYPMPQEYAGGGGQPQGNPNFTNPASSPWGIRYPTFADPRRGEQYIARGSRRFYPTDVNRYNQGLQDNRRDEELYSYLQDNFA